MVPQNRYSKFNFTRICSFAPYIRRQLWDYLNICQVKLLSGFTKHPNISPGLECAIYISFLQFESYDVLNWPSDERSGKVVQIQTFVKPYHFAKCTSAFSLHSWRNVWVIFKLTRIRGPVKQVKTVKFMWTRIDWHKANFWQPKFYISWS